MLSSSYGLAADNVLEWEVVTASGEHLVATPDQHNELYWALSGGGGGTYAVALSMTARLHQDGLIGGGSVSFNDTATGNDVFWSAVAAWIAQLPAFLDDGNYMLYQLTNTTFSTATIVVPAAQDATQVVEALAPFLAELDRRSVPYAFEAHTSPTFLEHYAQDTGSLPFGPFPASQLISSRLLPREVVMDPDRNAVLATAMQRATATGHFVVSCQGLNGRKPLGGVDNAVLPAWRDSVSLCLIVGSWDWSVPRAEMVAHEAELMGEIMPALVAATPGSGIYLNEGNFQQVDWQSEFYGENYPALARIKARYDPDGLFFATTAVGSEDWILDGDGRLCRQNGRSSNI
jgi:FAD/FMN-containing dehydrogenase